jgi:hypothetical protein
MKTTNAAGGAAFKIASDKTALVLSVVTSFFGESKFHGSTDTDIVDKARAIIKKDPKFVSNLALFAREQLNLRSVSHVLAAELAHINEGKPFARLTVSGVCKRPDDMTEILAYYIGKHGKPIPNALKKGLADAFGRFDEYQLAKYNRDNTVKLKDVYSLVHPPADEKKNPERYALYGRLLAGTMAIPYTWETELSAKGNNKDTWNELIESRRLPYMATLRNLRNIHNSGTPNAHKAYEYIANAEAVAKSRQLPFRFYSAHRELQQQAFASEGLRAVEQALDHSLSNVIKLPGKTFIMSDASGSMSNPLSTKSTLTYKDVAMLMSSMANSISEEATVAIFGQDYKFFTVTPEAPVLQTVQFFNQQHVGHATYLHKPLEALLASKTKVDRIVVFSDMQAYTQRQLGFSGWGRTAETIRQPQEIINQYRKEVNPDVWVHSVDLTGHSTTQFMGKNVNLMGGWSEKILDYILLAEKGMGTLVEEIQSYTN